MIGVFDSGVGGMTVSRAIEKILPAYRQIYFGDLARSPYGSKSPATITRYAFENTEFLLSKGATLIVVACNSAASAAAESLSKAFDVPIFEVITPAVESSVESSARGRIGVIGTRATIMSGIYEKKIREIDPSFQVFSTECPLLVPLVEEGWSNKKETKTILKSYLNPLKYKAIDTLVLGCTHYPLLKDLIQPRIGKGVRIIDSSETVAAGLKTYLENNPEIAASLCKSGVNQYYVSDITEAAKITARRIFGREILLEPVSSYKTG
ncbi:MAG: glutamate racemase [Proteobacteria bacterium]|nr:glutamate racemase [Pseudomonadota bacterium]MBU1710384.1 glutamate racemase [Pseudomonadota bacterium]